MTGNVDIVSVNAIRKLYKVRRMTLHDIPVVPEKMSMLLEFRSIKESCLIGMNRILLDS